VDGFLESLHAALGRGEVTIAPRRDASSSEAAIVEADVRDERTVARELSAMIDRAIERGQWEAADRVARTATRLVAKHPVLGERVARLHAARGDFDSALAVIDAGAVRPASMRMLRVVCLLQLGRRCEAHLDLHEWARRSSAPVHARLVLALLEHAEGDDEAACLALQRNLRQIEDPHSLAALMLLAMTRRRAELARLWAQRLRCAIDGYGSAAMFEVMLAACGFPQRAASRQETPTAAAALAVELIGRDHLVPALVEAQRLHGDVTQTRLLTDALTLSADEMDAPHVTCDALANLHAMLGDRELSAAWRGRAVAVNAQREHVLATIGSPATRGSSVAQRWRPRASEQAA
jgi:hypothetical protein